VQNPTLPLSHVIAASAAFPVLIGPYILQTENLRFTQDKHGKKPYVPVDNHYTLWDGGVYDNLGLDPLFTTRRGLDAEINFLIVSNASASIEHKARRGNISLANLRRLLDISQNQVAMLRTNEVLAQVVRRGRGMYFKIGYTARHIADLLHIPLEKILAGDALTREDATRVRDYPTTLNSPTPADYDLIFRHGYENAKIVHTVYKNPWPMK